MREQGDWGSFDEELAQEMKGIDFAKEVFLFELKEFGETVEKVLWSTIEKMDKAWFAEQVGEQVDAINSFVSGERKLTDDEMSRYLAVLGLKRTGTHSVEELLVAVGELVDIESIMREGLSDSQQEATTQRERRDK